MNSLLNFASQNPLQALLLSALLGAAVSAVVAWVLWRGGKQKLLQEAIDKHQTIEQMRQQQMTQLQTTNAELMGELDQQEAEVLRLNKLSVQLDEQLKHSRQQASQAEQLRTALGEAEIKLTQMRSEVEHQQQRFKQQHEFLEQSKTLLADHFNTLGQKILEEKSARFSTQSKEQMDQVIKPLNQQLKDFQSLVHNTSTQGLAQQKSLKMEIERVYQLNQELSKKAEDLTKALTAESKTQGNWGEMVLHRLLEVAGLEQGREYDTEVSFTNADQKRYRPDVLIHLPQEKALIVDAKVSLKAFEQYVNAEQDSERQVHLKQHVQSMQTHIKNLSEKAYQNIEQLDSVDFVLMFVPVESAFVAAINAQPGLLEEAYKKNVLILSASNLLATLRTVMMLWQNENQNKNAQVIADKAGKMYDKFVGFVENLSDIKMRLDQADDAWHAAENKLKSGRGNLLRQADTLKQLGARNSKNLPSD